MKFSCKIFELWLASSLIAFFSTQIMKCFITNTTSKLVKGANGDCMKAKISLPLLTLKRPALARISWRGSVKRRENFFIFCLGRQRLQLKNFKNGGGSKWRPTNIKKALHFQSCLICNVVYAFTLAGWVGYGTMSSLPQVCYWLAGGQSCTK